MNRYNRNYHPPRRRIREKEQKEEEEEKVEQEVEEYEADFESEEEYLNHLNNKEEDEVDGDGEEEEVNACTFLFTQFHFGILYLNFPNFSSALSLLTDEYFQSGRTHIKQDWLISPQRSGGEMGIISQPAKTTAAVNCCSYAATAV